MRQVRLKSVVGKLSIWVVYLLFLSVQLNLRYTFPDDFFTPVPGSSSNIQAAKEGKPSIQKLRLNKRFEHEQIYEVASQPEIVLVIFPNTPDQIIIADQIIPASEPVASYLRGPPSPFVSLI